MYKFKCSLLLSIVTVCSLHVSGQDLPNLPPSIKWQQIQSEHFKIIYPKGLEEEAQRTTNILENIYEPASSSLGAQPRRFPIVLQNQYAVSNGFVTVAPYRSELFMFEPQNYRRQGNDRWLERLAVHEYRHIVQFEKAITPFNKALFFLMGEFGPFLSAAAAAPQWFYEGDAVGIETAFGRSGRGRIPSFTMAFKANLIDKGGFNYYKQHLKSYRDLVPNHYVTGYLMTTYLKNNNGVDVWDKIVGRSFKLPFIPFTFSNAMKRASGKHLLPTYDDMLAEQKELYTQQLNAITPTDFTLHAHKINKVFTNYYFPRYVLNDQILAVKFGFSQIPALVLIDASGEEKKIHELGVWQNHDALSSNKSSVVWIELELDPRWQRRAYTVIKKLNLETKKLTRLSLKSKYLAPAISNNGKWVAAIHQSETGLYAIHLLDANTGELIRAFENNDNQAYSTPLFDPKDENLLLLKYVDDGKAIVQKDITSGEERTLYFSDTENLGNPVIQEDWLFYATDHNGIDNIYALNVKDLKRYQVTSSRFGAFSPRPSSGKILVYNDYTADGFEIAEVVIDPKNWIPVEDVKDVGFNFQEKMVNEEGHHDILYNYPDSVYASTSYPKVARIVRPHTWGVNAVPSDDEFSVGVFSKDILQTTTVSASGIHNYNEKVWRGEAKVSYQALYPIIDFTAGFGRRATSSRLSDGSVISYNWLEEELELGARVPFYLTNSKYSKIANLGISYQYIYTHDFEGPRGITFSNENQKLFALNYNASFFRLLRRNFLDLNSKWGQTLAINYSHTPLGGNIQSELFAAESNLYFPGLFNHHSLHIRGAYQNQIGDSYPFSSPIRYTRGYSYMAYEQFVNLSVNYKLPLVYMDVHLGPILNVQRIYTNIFFDQGIGRDPGQPDERFYSVGAELSFNFNLFRLLPLFDMGVRYSYLPDFEDEVIEVVFGGVTF